MSKRPLEIRRLNTCTFAEALRIWNENQRLGTLADGKSAKPGYAKAVGVHKKQN